MSRVINNTSSEAETSGQGGTSTISQVEDERDIVEANSETNTSGQVGTSTITQTEEERDFFNDSDTYEKELVTNGSFDTNSDWLLGTGWSIQNGKVICDGTQTDFSDLRQNGLIASSKIYKVGLDIEAISGVVELKGSGSYQRLDLLGVGTHTIYITSDNTFIRFTAYSGATITMDNVSVKEVVPFDDTTGQVGTSTITQIEDERNFDNASNTYEKELATNGNFDTNSDWSSTNSTISILSGVCQVSPTSTFGYLNSTSSFQTVIGREYVYSFDCISRTGSGNVYLQIGTFQNGNDVTNQNIGEIEDNTSYSVIFTATSATSYLRIGFSGDGTSATIDNVSIKEVVPFDDTSGQVGTSTITQVENERNINSGLGQELITNGGFDADSDWNVGTGFSISGGVVSANAPTGNLDQSVSVLAGKTYRVEFTILNYVSGDIRFRFTGTSNENGTLRTADGTYVEEITLTNNQALFRFPATGGIMDIDNVSVKEVI